MAAFAFFDGVFIGAPIALLAASFSPLVVYAVATVVVILLVIACCSWVDRRWDDWFSGNSKRIEARLEGMRKSRLMQHPVAWIQRGSDRWYAFAAAVANPILVAALARFVGGKPVGRAENPAGVGRVRHSVRGDVDARRLRARRRSPQRVEHRALHRSHIPQDTVRFRENAWLEMSEQGAAPTWQPERIRLRPVRLVVSWLITAASLAVAAALLPGVDVAHFGGALVVALVIGALNAVLPPVLAALRLPLTLVLGFLIALVASALLLEFAADILESFTVDNFWWALLAALVMSAVVVVLEVIFSANDDDTYTLRVVQRIAKRQGGATRTDAPGVIFLEIDGLALPVLRRAMRDGNAPNMARWLQDDTHRLLEWEPDLSSQTGASQAGILLGSNEDIPAFRWVEKETGTMMTCSAPDDCARIERERATGIGLLIDGGASRGNLLSGEAEAVILTVSRMEEEKRANPGYRAFFANAFNVSRALVLFVWEVILEWTAALRAKRRDVRPRGHRGGIYPLHARRRCA